MPKIGDSNGKPVSKRTISLTADQAEFLESKVTSGDYASASEVVRAGLRALQEREAAIERWLREEVAPAYASSVNNPDQGVSVDVARQNLTRYIASRRERAVA